MHPIKKTYFDLLTTQLHEVLAVELNDESSSYHIASQAVNLIIASFSKSQPINVIHVLWELLEKLEPYLRGIIFKTVVDFDRQFQA